MKQVLQFGCLYQVALEANQNSLKYALAYLCKYLLEVDDH